MWLNKNSIKQTLKILCKIIFVNLSKPRKDEVQIKSALNQCFQAKVAKLESMVTVHSANFLQFSISEHFALMRT